MSETPKPSASVVRRLMCRPVWGVVLAVSVGIYIGEPGRSLGQVGSNDFCPSDLRSDTLPEFAKKCAAAIGEEVPAFDCDAGTEVPETHLTGGGYPNGVCDAPKCSIMRVTLAAASKC